MQLMSYVQNAIETPETTTILARMIGNNSYTVLETTTRMNPIMIMTRTKTIPVRTMVSII